MTTTKRKAPPDAGLGAPKNSRALHVRQHRAVLAAARAHRHQRAAAQQPAAAQRRRSQHAVLKTKQETGAAERRAVRWAADNRAGAAGAWRASRASGGGRPAVGSLHP